MDMLSQAETALWGAQRGKGGGSSSPSRWDEFSICFLPSLECLNASYKKVIMQKQSPRQAEGHVTSNSTSGQYSHTELTFLHNLDTAPGCPCTVWIQTSGLYNQLFSSASFSCSMSAQSWCKI